MTNDFWHSLIFPIVHNEDTINVFLTYFVKLSSFEIQGLDTTFVREDFLIVYLEPVWYVYVVCVSRSLAEHLREQM